MSSNPALVVCMGVSGSGKSTLGRLLADSFDLAFIDADDYHSGANKQRMSAGIALTDEDRAPWMDDICRALCELRNLRLNCVLAHSALRRQHRNRLRNLDYRVLFLHLAGTPDLIAQRLRDRSNHFARTDLLESQFEALEPTEGEDDVVEIDIGDDEALVTERSTRLVGNFVAAKDEA